MIQQEKIERKVVLMSKYTTELRFVCETYAGLTESTGYNNIDTVVAQALPKLFDFDFPIFDEAYRTTLEKKIVLHYYTRELGYETVGRWKLALKTKLNELMPYYNELYQSSLLDLNPLYTHDMYRKKDNTQTEAKTTSDNSTKTTNMTKTGTTDHDITIDDTGHNNPNETTYNLHSDTPQGGLTGLDDMTYMSDAEKTTRTGQSTTSNHHTDLMSGNTSETNSGTVGNTKTGSENGQRVDDYLEHVYGYGGYSPSKLLKEYRETFLNIDMMIINDLSKLFMGIW